MTAQTDSLWERIRPDFRKRFVWVMWFVTWIGLLAGLFDRLYYEYVVVFSAIHALLMLVLFGFQVSAFPVQVRIAYFAWVAIGTYVPYMTVLMYITTIGLATNLFLNYCPLARMLYLLPWNREESISLDFMSRVFLSAPVKGKFKVTAPVS